MIMRMSTLFVRTLREDPADAEVPSHRLLVRAGYIRRAAPGIYTWLPLGLKVLRKIEGIIREEMDGIGAQELSFPALLPREPYEATGRWTEYGPNIFRLQDRKGNDYLLGPTHEEMFTLVVKDLYGSYKDLPLSIYQIQTKYRDEARPRAGLLRGREFVMKDSYSFDVDDAGLEASYQKHRDAYIRIFDRLGFEYVIVSAMSGAMGGSMSEEFLAAADNGEDTYVRCTTCDYAANVEAVRVPTPAPVAYDDAPAAHAEQTPDTPTIQTLVDHLNDAYPRDDRAWEAADTLKNVHRGPPPPRRHPRAPRDRRPRRPRGRPQAARRAGLPRGDRGLRREGLRGAPGTRQGLHRPRRAGGEERVRHPLPRSTPASVEGTRWVTGADVAGSHVIDLVAGRDFTADGTIEAAEVREGDPCPNGDGTLHTARGIEMGHIFALGRKFADALDLKVLDENGKLVTVTMGSYGIGASRAVAAIAEGTLDEIGLCWPREVAPADVHIVAAGKDPELFAAAERIAHELSSQGIEVLYDDRTGKISPGVKFKDAELIGIPTIVVIGKGLADGVIEIKDRASGHQRAGRGGPRRRPRGEARSRVSQGIDAVIFDWGGTLTRWHDVDFHAESLALAQAVIDVDHDLEVSQARLHAANETVWGRSRDHQQSATVADLFTEAGLGHDPDLLTAYYEFWEPHTLTDPEVGPLFEWLRGHGHQGRRAVQHDLAPRLARGVLRSRRCRPPDRRGRLHQRDRVDQAFSARVPGSHGRRRGQRPEPLCLRRRPALRRHLGRPQRRPAGDPHPAERDPDQSGRPHRGRSRRGGPPAVGHRGDRRSLALTLDVCTFVQCRNVRNRTHRTLERAVACFCKSGAGQSPHIPAGATQSASVQASAVRVLAAPGNISGVPRRASTRTAVISARVGPGEHLRLSLEDDLADGCLVQSRDRPAAHRLGRVRDQPGVRRRARLLQLAARSR